ncbi:MAG: ATP-binding cassette domain-containing protein [Clostridia bacterium]
MIEVKDLNKKIKNEYILKDINLCLKEGNVYGFVGRNGSGKSMLFKTIAGFVLPTSGAVFFNGVDIYAKGVFAIDTRVLIDTPYFIETLSALDNLKMLANINKVISKEDILAVLKDLDLLDEKDELVRKYSLGMKQKLGIAQAIMEDSKVIILDEPFNGLDECAVKIVRNIILREKEKGKIILLASHIKEDINLLCDKVFYIENGSFKNI